MLIVMHIAAADSYGVNLDTDISCPETLVPKVKGSIESVTLGRVEPEDCMGRLAVTPETAEELTMEVTRP